MARLPTIIGLEGYWGLNDISAVVQAFQINQLVDSSLKLLLEIQSIAYGSMRGKHGVEF